MDPIEMSADYYGRTVTFARGRHATSLPYALVIAAVRDVQAGRIEALERNTLHLDEQTLLDAITFLDDRAAKVADLQAEASYGWQS